MWIDVKARVGFNGVSQNLVSLWLGTGTIGSASSWSGSYHVLAMGRHYDQYAVTPRTVLLPGIPGCVIPHPYMRLAGKIRAAGVTGNIGEAIAAVFAVTGLGLTIGDIVHIRPKSGVLPPQDARLPHEDGVCAAGIVSANLAEQLSNTADNMACGVKGSVNGRKFVGRRT